MAVVAMAVMAASSRCTQTRCERGGVVQLDEAFLLPQTTMAAKRRGKKVRERHGFQEDRSQRASWLAVVAVVV